MTYRVVTIATVTGAFSEETGRLVAEELGFHAINDEIIEWAAEYAGVSRDVLESLEHSGPLVDRIVSAMAEPDTGDRRPATAEDPSPAYRRLIQAVIRAAAERGNIVIIAHGAGMLLAGAPGVLRVLVTASPGTRAARLAASGMAPAAAEQQVSAGDAERAAYFRRFFGLDAELPVHYDLVVNTDHLSPRVAARMIAAAVH